MFTVEELAQYDGTDSSKPIYLAVKKTVYDVSKSIAFYGPGGSYKNFAGKDASRALGLFILILLGMSTTKIEHCLSGMFKLLTQTIHPLTLNN